MSGEKIDCEALSRADRKRNGRRQPKPLPQIVRRYRDDLDSIDVGRLSGFEFDELLRSVDTSQVSGLVARRRLYQAESARAELPAATREQLEALRRAVNGLDDGELLELLESNRAL